MILRDQLVRAAQRTNQLLKHTSNILQLRRSGVRQLEIIGFENRFAFSTPPSPTSASVREQSADHGAATRFSREIVFIDSSAKNCQQFLSDLWSHQDPHRRLDVVLLSPNENGLNQISKTLAQYQTEKLDAIHMVTPATDRAIKLGYIWLDSSLLHANREQIANWGEALKPGADLLIYGCDLAEKALGRALLNQLLDLTGAVLAASIDDTESKLLGSGWELRCQQGRVEAEVAFSCLLPAEWGSQLNAFAGTNANESGESSLRQAILDAYVLTSTSTICSATTAPSVRAVYTSELLSVCHPIPDTLAFDGRTGTGSRSYCLSVIERKETHTEIICCVPDTGPKRHQTQPNPSSGGIDTAKQSYQRAKRAMSSARKRSVHRITSAMQAIWSDPIPESILQNTEIWNQLNTFLDRLRRQGQASPHLSRQREQHPQIVVTERSLCANSRAKTRKSQSREIGSL